VNLISKDSQLSHLFVNSISLHSIVAMSLITFSLFALFVSTSAINNETQTLNNWYKEVESKLESIGDPFNDFIESLDRTCITGLKLNLNQNGQKLVNFPEAMIAIYGAGMECFEEEKKTALWNLMIKILAASYEESIEAKNIKCFKKEFQKVKTNNYLVDNTPIILTPSEVKLCEALVDDIGFQSHIKKLENIFGTSILTFTCSKTNYNDIKRLFLSVIVIHGNQDKNLHIVALAKEFKDRLNKAFVCVMNRIQNYESRFDEITEKTEPLQPTQIYPGHPYHNQNYLQYNNHISHASASASSFSYTNNNPGQNNGANMNPALNMNMNINPFYPMWSNQHNPYIG